MSDPDSYGKRGATQLAIDQQKTPVITSTADIQKVCRMAADAVIASAKKVAGDVLAAADVIEAVAQFIIKDAEMLAENVQRSSHTLSDRINQFASAGDIMADANRTSKEQLMAMQEAVMGLTALSPTKEEPDTRN